MQIVFGFLGNQNNLGCDGTCFCNQATAGLGHDACNVAKACLNHLHHLTGICFGCVDGLAVERREPTADVQQVQRVTFGFQVRPNGCNLIQHVTPHFGAACLRTDVEGQANRLQAQFFGVGEQRRRFVTGAAELACQRPVCLTVFNDQTDVNLCAGRVLGQLFQFFFRVGREQVDTNLMRPCDVGYFFDGVAKGNLLGACALGQAHFDFHAGRSIKVRTKTNQRVQDFRRGVCFDRIVDIGLTQTCAQGAELTGHTICVDDQCRTVKAVREDVLFDTGTGNIFRGREIGYVCVHGHLQ